MAQAVLEMEQVRNAAPAPYDGFDKMLLNGTWRHGRDGRTADDLDPYTNEVLVRIPLANEQDVDEAYRAADEARRKWSRSLPGERSAVLRRAASIMEARRDEIVDWLGPTIKRYFGLPEGTITET